MKTFKHSKLTICQRFLGDYILSKYQPDEQNSLAGFSSINIVGNIFLLLQYFQTMIEWASLIWDCTPYLIYGSNIYLF